MLTSCLLKHTLLQQLPGFVNLRALYVIQLRNDDTCVWVMRETKRFLIDNLSHYPHLKLEWLSIDDDTCAEHIVRPTEASRKAKQKSKGKEKATDLANGSASDAFPILPVTSWDAAGESDVDDDDDGDDDDDDLRPPKLETESVHFADIWGVRIFKKEVTFGRL